MRALMRSLAPTSFEDICALLALYRPGPMAANMHNDYADRKNGRKPVEHLHPDAEEVLGDTYGLMIYQESLLRVAQKFAGFSLADADLLRRACGKKKRDLIAQGAGEVHRRVRGMSRSCGARASPPSGSSSAAGRPIGSSLRSATRRSPPPSRRLPAAAAPPVCSDRQPAGRHGHELVMIRRRFKAMGTDVELIVDADRAPAAARRRGGRVPPTRAAADPIRPRLGALAAQRAGLPPGRP